MLSILSILFASAAAHSWVHCTDYRGSKEYYDDNQCFGNVRPLDRNPGDIIVPAQVRFGQDQGFNRNNADGNANFRPVDGKCQSLITDQMAGGDFPMATYQRGQRVTLAWPAKNHAAAGCTNQFIPDGFVKVFVEPYKNAQGNRFNQEIDGTWRQFPHTNGQIDFRGFQNCPKFCEDPDKALCTGDFTVPDLPDGKYSFQWLWEFNPGDEYVTCWEAEVKGATDNNPAANVISTDGCHNNMDEETCMAAVDGRGDWRGEKCAWCCGEFCNKDATGGNGGANRCEPRRFLEEQAGVTAFRNNEVDQCPQPTNSPTTEPTAAPSVKPSEMPSEMPTPEPTMMPTTPSPTESSEQIPAPGDATTQLTGATNPLMGAPGQSAGQCVTEWMLCKGTMMPNEMQCCAGLMCMDIGGGMSQCKPANMPMPSPNDDSDDSSVSSGVVLVAILLSIATLCCMATVVFVVWKSRSGGKSGDMYLMQDGYDDSDIERYERRQYQRYDDDRDDRRKTKRSSHKGFTANERRDRRRGEPSITSSDKSKSKNSKNTPYAPTPRTPGSEEEYVSDYVSGVGSDYVSDQPGPGKLTRKQTPV